MTPKPQPTTPGPLGARRGQLRMDALAPPLVCGDQTFGCLSAS